MPYSTPLREQQPATACTYICTYACDIYRAATFTATARLLMIGDTADSSTLPKKNSNLHWLQKAQGAYCNFNKNIRFFLFVVVI